MTTEHNPISNTGYDEHGRHDWRESDERERISSDDKTLFKLTALMLLLIIGITLMAVEGLSIDLAASTYKYNCSVGNVQPTGIFMSSDGVNLYVSQDINDYIQQYSLTTPFDCRTAVAGGNMSFASSESRLGDFYISRDGTKLYILGYVNQSIRQFTLTTPWLINTSTLVGFKPLTPYDTGSYGLTFKDDGSVFYFTGGQNKKIYQFNMTTPWDLTSAVNTNNLSVIAQTSVPTDIELEYTGLFAYITDYTNGKVHQYNLSVPWNISSGVINAFKTISEMNGTHLDSLFLINNMMLLVGDLSNKSIVYNVDYNNNFSVYFYDNQTGGSLNNVDLVINGVTYLNQNDSYISLINDSRFVNVTVSKANYRSQSFVNYNSSTTLIVELSSTAYSYLNVSVLYEVNESLMIGKNISLSFFSDIYSQFNYTLTGLFNDTLGNFLADNVYKITVNDNASKYSQSIYYFYAVPVADGVNNIQLYMNNASLTGDVCWELLDSDGNPVSAYVKLYKFYSGSYKVVQVGKTDSLGLLTLKAIVGSDIYKYSLFTDLSLPPVYSSAGNVLQSTTCYKHYIAGSIVLDSNWFNLNGINYLFSYNNVTNTTMLSWSDPNSLVTSVCLDTNRLSTYGGDINYTCVSSAAGSVYHYIPSVTGEYVSKGYALINGSTYYIGSISKIMSDETISKSKDILFLGLLMLLVLVICTAFLGLLYAIIIFCGGLFLLKAIGLISISIGLLIVILVIGIIVALTISKKVFQ